MLLFFNVEQEKKHSITTQQSLCIGVIVPVELFP